VCTCVCAYVCARVCVRVCVRACSSFFTNGGRRRRGGGGERGRDVSETDVRERHTIVQPFYTIRRHWRRVYMAVSFPCPRPPISLVRHSSCGSLYTGVSKSIATIDWQSKQLFRACRQLTMLTHTLPPQPPPPPTHTHNTHTTQSTHATHLDSRVDGQEDFLAVAGHLKAPAGDEVLIVPDRVN
jgi:hypothetical protein